MTINCRDWTDVNQLHIFSATMEIDFINLAILATQGYMSRWEDVRKGVNKVWDKEEGQGFTCPGTQDSPTS